ncbi:SAM-dependent methyltransferase [Amycolatopsis sp. H20-H5]|nr:SAM-dependent methyltransferase [Amycolatopsis sp. H20-H5]MEC3977071.1 SAM-dependent methyltransferase [Amycolatopsis sp. H20-H5]
MSLDFDRPSIARIFDALVGGRDHDEADHEALGRILARAPEALEMARELRHWLTRTVRYLADRAGVDQFLDLGSGFPTAENTHQVARRYNPEAQVVYVDSEPDARALLEENDFTHLSGSDLTDPAATLADPALARHLDFTRPIGLILCSIIHHIDDVEQARETVRGYVDAMAPGSYLVLAHQFDPADDSEVAASPEERFGGTGLDTLHRTREEIESFFEGLDYVEPGLTFPHLWWPDGPRFTPLSTANFTTLGGVAHIN